MPIQYINVIMIYVLLAGLYMLITYNSYSFVNL